MNKPNVVIRSVVEKEIFILENGLKIPRRIPVGVGLMPNALKLYFTLTIVNEGDDVAKNVVIDNPIPPGTVYAMGSAKGVEGTVHCSIDNGESYHFEHEQINKPTSCTDIRWMIEKLEPGVGCILSFQVTVAEVRLAESKPSMAALFSILKMKQLRNRVMDFPGFARHQIALKSNSVRGVYDKQPNHRINFVSK